jgi:hypothetical protein
VGAISCCACRGGAGAETGQDRDSVVAACPWPWEVNCTAITSALSSTEQVSCSWVFRDCSRA